MGLVVPSRRRPDLEATLDRSLEVILVIEVETFVGEEDVDGGGEDGMTTSETGGEKRNATIEIDETTDQKGHETYSTIGAIGMGEAEKLFAEEEDHHRFEDGRQIQLMEDLVKVGTEGQISLIQEDHQEMHHSPRRHQIPIVHRRLIVASLVAEEYLEDEEEDMMSRIISDVQDLQIATQIEDPTVQRRHLYKPRKYLPLGRQLAKLRPRPQTSLLRQQLQCQILRLYFLHNLHH